MRRCLTYLLAVLMGALCVPAVALAAGQSFQVTSATGFPANGDPSYTTTLNFDSAGGGPKTAIVTLAPGVLASLAANPSCVRTVQETSACEIGTGTAKIQGLLPLSVKAYLVPPPSKADLAGIDLVSSAGTTPASIQLKQTPSGNVSSVLAINFSSLGKAAALVTSTSLTVNGTLNGKPFTRMPSNCSPGASTLTVDYSNGSSMKSTASPDFKPTGCSSLPYAPHLKAVLRKDAKDDGVNVVMTVTQAANQAASAGNALQLPWPSLGPNFSGLSLQCSVAPCAQAVGKVSTTSPLLPKPLVGKVYLTGTPLGPNLTLLFPPPSALTLVGVVKLTTSTVTFTGLPDVPQTSLAVTLFGGPEALEITTCKPPSGLASGTFTSQGGAVSKVTQHVVVTGCKAASSPRPALSKVSLLSKHGGHTLRFTLSAGKGAKLASFKVAPPAGFKFKRSGMPSGLSLSRASTASVRGGKLVVRLKRAAQTITVSVKSPLLAGAGSQSKHARLRVAVTDTKGRTTTITAPL